MEESTTFRHVELHITTIVERSPVYSHLCDGISLVSASPDRVIVHLKLQKKHMNSKGTLHGSVSATLVDFMGGIAIASHDERENTGVSTDMHISFLGSAKENDLVEIEGIVDRCGGTLAYTTATIRKVDQNKGQASGDIIAKGTHTKFVKSRS